MKAIIYIKPLSVNQAWKGRRFKTDKYKTFERECMLLLKASNLPKPPFELFMTFGMANKMSDVDNPVKTFVDVLQKKYDFNDKDIIKMTIEKVKVKKGEEFINYELKTLRLK